MLGTSQPPLASAEHVFLSKLTFAPKTTLLANMYVKRRLHKNHQHCLPTTHQPCNLNISCNTSSMRFVRPVQSWRG